MPINGLTKAYRAYVRERRYWRRRQRIEANRQVHQQDVDSDERRPRAVGGRATVVNVAPVLGREENRDMPVVVGSDRPRRTRMAEVLSSDASTVSVNESNDSILNVPQEMERPGVVTRGQAIAHERDPEPRGPRQGQRPQRQGQYTD